MRFSGEHANLQMQWDWRWNVRFATPALTLTSSPPLSGSSGWIVRYESERLQVQHSNQKWNSTVFTAPNQQPHVLSGWFLKLTCTQLELSGQHATVPWRWVVSWRQPSHSCVRCHREVCGAVIQQGTRGFRWPQPEHWQQQREAGKQQEYFSCAGSPAGSVGKGGLHAPRGWWCVLQKSLWTACERIQF